MEKEIKIRTKDGKHIYGKLRGSLKNPLIIFVHGLTGHMDEHIFYNGARFFEKKGFSTFRFNLYDNWDNARKLHDCDLKTHAGDLNQAVKHFQRKKIKDICAVGHSYGGPAILLSKTENYRAIVLLDPTMDPDVVYRKTIADKKADGFIREWSFKFILGKKMVSEAKNLPDFTTMAKENKSPVKIILAGGGNAQSKRKKDYFKAFSGPKKMVIFKKAGHTFSEDGVEEKLFSETLSWVDKFKNR